MKDLSRSSLEEGMRAVRAVASLVVLAVLLFGVPWIILEWGAWEEVKALVLDPSLLLVPDDGHFVLAVLTVLGAGFWVALACGIIVEIVEAARRRARGRRAVPRRGGPLQWVRVLVRPLVTAVFALAVIGGNSQTAMAEEPARQAPISASAWEDEAFSATDPIPTLVLEAAEPDPSEETVHVVEPGDSLWSIAESVYGDGQLWTKIAQENEDLVQGTSDLIQVGWRLKIPPLDPAQPQAPAADVVVEPGDSLWSIAEKEMGDGAQWPQIFHANPLITDPGLIQPGWELVLPDPVGDTDTMAEGGGATPPDPPDPSEVEVPYEEQASYADDGPPAESVLEPVVPTPPYPASPMESNGGQSQQGRAESPSPGESAPEPETPDMEMESLAIDRAVGVTAVLAGGMVLMFGRRRLNQMRARPVGRRILHPGEEGRELETALGVVGNRTGTAAGRLDALTREDDPGARIVGISQDGADMWWMPQTGVKVCVGEDEEGEPVFADASGSKPFLVCGGSEQGVASVMRGIGMGLAVEESGAELHVVGAGDLFDTFDNLERHATYREAVDNLRLTITSRRTFLSDRQWEQLRTDENFGEAWRPVMYCFGDSVDEGQFCELAEALKGPDIGVGVVVAMVADHRTYNSEVVSGQLTVGPDRSILEPDHVTIRPCKLEPSWPLTDLLQTSASTGTTPAWWSSHGPAGHSSVSPPIERGSDMIPWQPIEHHAHAVGNGSRPIGVELNDPAPTTFSHPTLKMLGPIVLEGAQGVAPTRAERACMEYCAWLLEHPGTTASAMSQGLMVAEGTRRSNMSRLRGWLGQDEEGHPYLPEAYSGRIWLSAAVTSDWHRMCLLIAGGVEEVETPKLLQALELVRGAPLADAAPGQWHWAEEARTDMVSVIRDVGVVAARRCLDEGDVERARWAANRALVAAPEDELLLGARVLIEHATGNRLEVERLVSWITRNARNLGIDLLPQTVAILKEVISTPTTKE